MLVAGVLPGLAGGALGLFLGLMVLGACFAFAEVGLNVQAAQTERALGVAIMNRAHGFWSLGVMTGSLAGVRLANFELNAFWSLALGGGILLPLLIAVSLRLPAFDAAEERSQQSADPWRLPAGLVPIILVVFGATIAEGAMNDWATVYMREASWGGTARDGLAVSVFAGMVTLGRFAGDGICVRSGAVALARASLVLAIAGVAVLIGAYAMWQAIVGFGLVGLGVSTIFPLGVSATARLSPTNQARSVSVMTFGALSGFLIGPPLVGLVAEAAGMRIGFAVLAPGLVVSLALAARLAERPKA